MRIKSILQHDDSDCAAACLSMIFSYFGKNVSIRKIRNVAGTDREGTSGFGIIKCAEKNGFSCKGLAATEKNRLNEIPLPAILHFKSPKIEHYVVVTKIKKDKVIFCDPAIGKRSLAINDFCELWSGVFFILFPGKNFEKTDDKEGKIYHFLSLLKPHKKLVVNILIASILLSLFGIFLAFYFRYLIDEVLYSQIESTLNLCSICYLLVILFQGILNFSRSQLMTYLGSKIDTALLCDFFYHLVHLPYSFFTSRKTGEVLSRVRDTETIRQAVSSTLLSLIMDSIMIFVGGFFLLKMGSALLPIAIIPVLISSVVVWICARPFQQSIRERSISEAEKNANMYETINGISTVKSLATEEKAFRRAEVRIVDSAEKTLKLSWLGNLQNSIQGFISGLGTLLLYWIGSYFIFQGKMTLGQLISFITLSGYFLGPLSRLLTMQQYFQEVSVAAERLSDILSMEEESEFETGEENVFENGDIEFKNVSFSYGTRKKALSNISLKIPSGKKVAFVGMSGSGKTTLLKLLMKFYQVTDGEILVGGKSIDSYKTSEYRERIGYVPQESILFSGSIYENIIWSVPTARPEEVMTVAQISQAWNFIQNLPDKFNTQVGEQGATLSGGERQRIALARVLLKGPDCIFLDEATASLDSISEQAIMDTVYNRIKDKTTVIVAHRLSTIKDCDLIFVFEKGCLMESGTHEQLLKKQGSYFNLWSAQNGESKTNSAITSE